MKNTNRNTEAAFDVNEFIKTCNEDESSAYELNYVKGCAVVGGHFGDCGKGKFDDLIIRQYKREGYKVINIRGQGGGNAGHTVIEDITQKEYHFHYLPSGGLESDLILLGGGMLLDPIKILEEASVLPESQQSRILIDGRATFCTLLERKMDGYYEETKAKNGSPRVGSTGSGVGPAVSFRALRCHIQFFKAKACKSSRELKVLFDKIQGIPDEIWEDIANEYGSVQHYVDLVYEAIQKLNIVESLPIIQGTRNRGWAMVLEVSQAFCLDSIFGNEGNFVTSTHTTVVGALADAGLTPADLTDGTIIVGKAYASKVGGGPFVTGFTYKDTIESSVAKYIYENNRERGVSTGRLRNLGWFDCVAIKAAIQRNGSRKLAINCMDTIGMIPGDVAKICIAYRHKESGKTTTFWPDRQSEYEPVYEELQTHWNIKHFRTEEKLPENVWRYLAHIEYYTGGTVNYIGTGGSNVDVIVVTDFGRKMINQIKSTDFNTHTEFNK